MNKTCIVSTIVLSSVASTAFSMLTVVRNPVVRKSQVTTRYYGTVKKSKSQAEQQANTQIALQRYFEKEQNKALVKLERIHDKYVKKAEKELDRLPSEERGLDLILQVALVGGLIEESTQEAAPFMIRNALLQKMESYMSNTEYSTLSEEEKVKKALKDMAVFIEENYQGKEEQEDKIIVIKAFGQIKVELGKFLSADSTHE